MEYWTTFGTHIFDYGSIYQTLLVLTIAVLAWRFKLHKSSEDESSVKRATRAGYFVIFFTICSSAITLNNHLVNVQTQKENREQAIEQRRNAQIVSAKDFNLQLKFQVPSDANLIDALSYTRKNLYLSNIRVSPGFKRNELELYLSKMPDLEVHKDRYGRPFRRWLVYKQKSSELTGMDTIRRVELNRETIRIELPDDLLASLSNIDEHIPGEYSLLIADHRLYGTLEQNSIVFGIPDSTFEDFK